MVGTVDSQKTTSNVPPFPLIKSTNSLIAKYLTPDQWEKLGTIRTKATGFTLEQAIACALRFDDQEIGFFAGDEDSYEDFKDVFDPVIRGWHNLTPDFSHSADLDVNKINGCFHSKAHIKSVRIRVGRSIEGFGFSPGITKDQRLAVENVMKNAFQKLDSDLSGNYYQLLGMDENLKQRMVDDHFLFSEGNRINKASGMERDWPDGRGIFHNEDKTFLVWVNEEDHLRIISMEEGRDIKGVFSRLVNGIKAIQDSIKAASGKDFLLHPRYGYLHSCPTNLGTGMRASVHIDLPGWTKEGIASLKARCKILSLQPRCIHGEGGGHSGVTYDISNAHRLGYSEVQLIQTMIDGVNTLYKEDLELQKKYAV